MSFFAELKRRNVFRVAASYVVVGWLIVQVVSALSGPLNLPEWFETVVVMLLAIGFPIALLFAWAFDLTPDGLKRTEGIDANEAATTGRGLDYALIGGLVIVAAVTVWSQIPSTSVDSAGRPDSVETAPSIAVLPFADMSPDGDQEYFGDGIAEELLNELVQLEGLRVAGRTSSFAFKGQNQDLRAIGDALEVSAILEGSVRRDGDRVRITAQLVDADDGYHIWSETYDRDFTDIFAIQEEIASAVAGSLGVTLGVGGVNAFLGAGTRSVEAYDAYMQALALDDDARTDLLERAIELDPDYAAAWAQLALAVAGSMFDGLPEEAPVIRDRGLTLAQRAVELDPESARAHSLLGSVLYGGHDWIGGEQAHARALALSRARSDLQQNGNLRMRAGRMTAARAQYDLAEAAEPLGGLPAPLSVHVSIARGRYDEAREIASWANNEQIRTERLLNIALNEGDPETIRAAIAALQPPDSAARQFYAEVLEAFESPENVLALLRARLADRTVRWRSEGHDTAMLAAYFGDSELALEAIASEVRYTPVRMFMLWYPIMAEARQLPGFKDLVREINLVDYWREYGWADACQPVGTNDFSCS